MTNCLTRAALAAILTLGAARANAQITTVISAPKRPEPTQQEVARREQVVQDSVARVTLTGMTQWVDSAAASLAIRPDTGRTPASDTSAAPPRNEGVRGDPSVTSQSVPATQPPANTPEFRDGAQAPDTATPAPTLALLGALLLVAGVVVWREPNAAKARARRW